MILLIIHDHTFLLYGEEHVRIDLTHQVFIDSFHLCEETDGSKRPVVQSFPEIFFPVEVGKIINGSTHDQQYDGYHQCKQQSDAVLDLHRL
jgi:hypothetical protein